MSLLDRGPDVVQVWPEVAGVDDDGNPMRVPAANPVTLWMRVQPVSAEEAATLGQGTSTIYRATGRDFPGGAFARVAWDGRDWDVLGEPLRYNGSPRTRHVSVLLKARGPAPLEG